MVCAGGQVFNYMKGYVVKKQDALTEDEKKRVDEFILRHSSNGEFINTFSYLQYHPKGRFEDDSVVVINEDSGTVEGCIAAVSIGSSLVISHPGTTFAGPVLDETYGIQKKEEILGMLLHYYETKYPKIELKLRPDYYSFQPDHTISYFLLNRGYTYGMSALANIVNISNIQSGQDVLQLFHTARRNHVKKVVKEDKFYFHKEDQVLADEWGHMNQNLKAKFNVQATHTWEEINRLKAKFPDKIMPYYVHAIEGGYGAFALVFCYKNVFHTQYLDVNYKYANQYPHLLLIYQLIQQAKELGYRYISFGASTEQGGKYLNYGLYNYKAGYGGGDVILPLYTKEMNL